MSQLDAVAETLGTSLIAVERVPWGDSGATWRLELGDGRRVVARAFTEAPDALGPDGLVDVMCSVSDAGIPVPKARSVTTREGSRWLVTDHVPGAVGARWLDDADRARMLADAMGRLRGRLLRADPTRISAPAKPLPSALTRHPDVARRTALDEARRVLERRSAGHAIVHGDFAPINVIVRDDGQIAALLDFEHAHIGDPLEDVAWWGWVVRHHHPTVWGAAWPTFCAAAGVDPIADGSALRALMLCELARRASSARDRIVRDRWLDRLTEAVAW